RRADAWRAHPGGPCAAGPARAAARGVPHAHRRPADQRLPRGPLGGAGEANRYFSAQQPWVLRTSDPERMATVLSVTLEVVRTVATLVQPVMPTAAGRLLTQLGLAEEVPFATLATPLAPGT